MGEELDTRGSSLGTQCLQSRTSSFDQQLWDELEAQARRRRSNEGTFDRGLVSRDAAYNAASPFARQLAMQGAPTLFGQPSGPSLPLPQRPSALGQTPPPVVPDVMASPFAAGASSRGTLAAQQALLAQAATAPGGVGQDLLPSGTQQTDCSGASARQHRVAATARPAVQRPQGKLGKTQEVALGNSEDDTRAHSRQQGSLVTGAGSGSSGKTGPPEDPPYQEPMGINELAVLSKRPKRMPVQQHRLAEVMAALDAKSSSRPNSFSSSVPSNQDHSSPAPQGNAAFTGFPKAASEGCEGSQITMSTLMGVRAVSQSVPELTEQGSISGTFTSCLQTRSSSHISSRLSCTVEQSIFLPLHEGHHQ